MINRFNLRALIWLAVLLVSSPGFSQHRGHHRKGAIPVRGYLYNLTADSAAYSRVGVAASFVNEHIQFVKPDSGYHARFFLSVEITDKKGKDLLALKDFSREIFAENFSETVKAESQQYWLGCYDLQPGEYKVTVKLYDVASKRKGSYSQVVVFKDFQDGVITNSHFVFVTCPEFDTEKADNILLTFSDKNPDSLFAMIEFQTASPGKKLLLHSQLQSVERKVLQDDSLTVIMDAVRKRFFLPINVAKLQSGSKLLVVHYEYLGKKYSTEVKILVNWGSGVTGPSLGQPLTIEHLRVVNNSRELRRIADETPSVRDSLLAEYWEKRDPTPGTIKNELYEELARRVEYANRNFSVMKKNGWRTDRGFIYMKYGIPDRVQQNISANTGFGQYEIWEYNEDRLQFIFYDQMGTNDYRLVSQY
ncbi:GWxTD domain-containing protein [bacterium]|nr:GWxTD domain-containing protein [bacterium]